MAGYKNILCATDFTEQSNEAAERAAAFARIYDARLTLLHVVEHFPVNRSSIDIAPEDVDPENYHEEKAMSMLASLAKKLKLRNVDREVRFSMESAQQEILRFAANHETDLIVVGAHDHHGVATVFSTTTGGVAQNSPCDVLAVHAH